MGGVAGGEYLTGDEDKIACPVAGDLFRRERGAYLIGVRHMRGL